MKLEALVSILCFLALLQPPPVPRLAANFVLKFNVENDPFSSAHHRKLLAYKIFPFAFRRRESPGCKHLQALRDDALALAMAFIRLPHVRECYPLRFSCGFKHLMCCSLEWSRLTAAL